MINMSFFDSKNLTFTVSVGITIAASFYIFFGPTSKKKSRKKGITCPGLINSGNSCFLNAVLQAMATCPSLVTWLNTVLLSSGDTGSRSKLLIYALQSALNVLNNEGGSDEMGDEYYPNEVLEALQAHRWFISPDQQDAHELFHVLTETLDEESTRYPPSLSLLDVKQLMDPSCEFQNTDVARNNIDTLLPILPHKKADNPFRGLLASQLQCTSCSFKYPVRYDKFDSLSVSLPGMSMSLRNKSVEDLLGNYVRPEKVFEVECEGCAKRNPASKEKPKSTFLKKLTIGKLPQCLCVHIQRTVWRDDGMPMKRHDHINFSESLNMEPYVYHCALTSKMENRVPWPPGLLGGKSSFGSASKTDSTHKYNKKKAEASPRVQAPYSQALNMLKAMHYKEMYSPQRGINVNSQSSSVLYNYNNSNRGDVRQLAHVLSLEQKFTVPKNVYKVTSVVQHMGDVFSGHFVTFRRAPSAGWDKYLSSKWLYTSDTLVRRVSYEDVKVAGVYMLFYEKMRL